jgi:hypothetical protein
VGGEVVRMVRDGTRVAVRGGPPLRLGAARSTASSLAGAHGILIVRTPTARRRAMMSDLRGRCDSTTRRTRGTDGSALTISQNAAASMPGASAAITTIAGRSVATRASASSASPVSRLSYPAARTASRYVVRVSGSATRSAVPRLARAPLQTPDAVEALRTNAR